MSFILDALKKSESERHRQSGPVLMDVRIAPPRRRIPAWAWVIAAVLLVNLSVLAWILWLSPANHAAPQVPAMVAAPPPAAAVAPTPASPPAQGLPAPVPPAPAMPQSSLPEPTLPAPSTRPDTAVQAPPPAVQAAPAASAPPPMQQIDVATLPKVADMVAAGMGLPVLQLSWHVYDAVPQSRYVLLNGARLREGEFTSDGVRVAAIVPTGVVVEWRGRQMFLNAGR
jgi:general secretion pathway protein B